MEHIHELALIYDATIQPYPLRGARGYVQKFREGYLILVDDWLSGHALERTLMHEFLHIKLGHLDERVDIEDDQKEEEVRNALKAMGY